MGRQVIDLHHRPDWRAQQTKDVEAVLADQETMVWVAAGRGRRRFRSGDPEH
jgi:hypothetical protein